MKESQGIMLGERSCTQKNTYFIILLMKCKNEDKLRYSAESQNSGLLLGFPGGSDIKVSASNAGDPGWEDPLEKEMATHSSILAWRIPWMEEPCRPQSMGSQRVRHDWATSLLTPHSSGQVSERGERYCLKRDTRVPPWKLKIFLILIWAVFTYFIYM